MLDTEYARRYPVYVYQKMQNKINKQQGQKMRKSGYSRTSIEANKRANINGHQRHSAEVKLARKTIIAEAHYQQDFKFGGLFNILRIELEIKTVFPIFIYHPDFNKNPLCH